MAGVRGSGNKKQGQRDKSQWGPVAFAYANAKENSKLSGKGRKGVLLVFK